MHYSRLCLQAPVLGHIVRRNIALQLLAREGPPFLQVPGEPPALVGSVQDLELVARMEAQVFCSPSLVVKQGHKVGALRPGSLDGAGALYVVRRHQFVCLPVDAGETGLQVPPEPPADVAHAALPFGEEGRGASLPLPFVSADSLSFPPPAALQSAPVPRLSGRHTWLPGETRQPACSCCPTAARNGSWPAAQWQDALSSCLLRNPTTRIKVRGLYVDKCLRTENSHLAFCPKKK